MKKHLLCLLLISSIASFSQENENTYTQDVEKKYELKVNAFNLIAFASLDVSFEKLINQNSSFGVAVFYNFSDLDDDEKQRVMDFVNGTLGNDLQKRTDYLNDIYKITEAAPKMSDYDDEVEVDEKT